MKKEQLVDRIKLESYRVSSIFGMNSDKDVCNIFIYVMANVFMLVLTLKFLLPVLFIPYNVIDEKEK